jgi:hypothetical protein
MSILAVAALLAADVMLYDVTVRTEGRMGSSPVVAGQNDGAVSVDAFLGTTWRKENLSVSAAYMPHFLTNAPQRSDVPSEMLHGGQLALDYKASPTTRYLLQTSGVYGTTDFSTLNAPPLGITTPPTIDPRAPVHASLVILRVNSSATLEQDVSREVRVTASASYMVSGGFDSIARAYIPQQHGPGVSAGVGWTVSRSDNLSLRATAAALSFSNGADIKLAILQSGWRHEWDPTLKGELGVGVGWGKSGGPSAPVPPPLFPTASARITRLVPLRLMTLSGSLGVLLTPVADYSGGLYELGQATGEVGLGLDKGLTLSARASVARALTSSPGLNGTLATGEMFGSYDLIGPLSIAAGVRGSWQQAPDFSGTTPPTTIPAFEGYRWAVFTALTLGAHGAM